MRPIAHVFLATLVAVPLVTSPAAAQGEGEEAAEEKAAPDEGDDKDEGDKDKADKDDDKDDDEDDKDKDDDEGKGEDSGIPGEAKPETHFLPHWMSVGVGFLGQAGGNFLDKPDDQSVPGVNCGANDQPCDPEYPGFAGFTGGLGFMIDIRFLGYVGIELDVMRAVTSKGSADIDIRINNSEGGYSVTFDNGAWHIPLLLKGTVPGSIVQPQLVLGPEFVIPDDDPHFKMELPSNNVAQCNEDGQCGPNSKDYGARSTGGYTLFTFGLGLEFMLPIPKVDIRIPLTLRGSVNPGVKGERALRGEQTVAGGTFQGEAYYTEWKFQAVANFGASWHF